MMNHVPGAGYLYELAPWQFRSKAPCLAIAVDNLVSETRQDRDRERQFGIVLC